MVGAEFGEQAERPLVVETPVDEALERRVGDGATPVVVAVPVRHDVGDVADLALLDAGDRGADPRRVAILVADLEDAFVGGGGVDDLCGVVEGVGHGLFAVDVVAGFERGQHVLGVEAERCGDDDGVEVFAIEKSAVVGGGGDLVSAGFVELGETRRIDVGGGDDFYSGDAKEAADEFLAAAAGADDAERKGELSVARAI